MIPTPFATIKPRLIGVLLRAITARKWPAGIAITNPVGTSTTAPGATTRSALDARSNPAAPAVWYDGNGTAGSRRGMGTIMLRASCSRGAYDLPLFAAAGGGVARLKSGLTSRRPFWRNGTPVSIHDGLG